MYNIVVSITTPTQFVGVSNTIFERVDEDRLPSSEILDEWEDFFKRQFPDASNVVVVNVIKLYDE